MNKFYTLAAVVGAVVFSNAQVSDLGGPAQVSDISNTGVAVGNVAGAAFFMWSESDSGAIIGESGENGVSGSANISADGKKISMALPNPSNDDIEEAVLYNADTGSLTFLGHLGTVSSNDTSSAWGMSSNGKNIVGFSWTSTAQGEAVLWKDGGAIQALGNTSASRSSRADAVSADGSVIAGYQDTNSGMRQGAVWKNGELQYLKDNSGNALGGAVAISADGIVVAGNTNTTGKAYIWHETEGTIILSADDAYSIVELTGLSDDGKTAVGFSYDPMGDIMEGKGFIWTKEQGKKYLDAYVTELGFDNKGITFSVASAISPNGKFVGGIGLAQNDFGVAGFVIELPESALGSQEMAPKQSLSVYPNPVKETLHLRSTHPVISAEVYNLAGQRILSVTKVNDNKFSAASLVKGMYLLKVQTSAGVQTVKIIKE